MKDRFVYGLPWIDPSLTPEDDVNYVTVLTPVGDRCVFCCEVIGPDDRGRLRKVELPKTPTCTIAELFAVHAECDIRLTQGSWDHVTGRCSCVGGPQDTVTGNTREDAYAVVAFLNERRTTAGLPPLW